EVVLSAGGDFGENLFFGRASAQSAADAVEQFGTAHEELFAGGQLHRIAESGASAGNDADFVDRIGVLAVSGDKRMTDFVIGDAALLVFTQAPALAFGAGHDFFDGVFEV